MSPAINVTKRNGTKEAVALEKIHKVVAWACEGLTGVSPSEVEIRSQIQFFDKMKTSDIHEMLIQAAAELISEETPNYQHVAGRLITFALRKEVYGEYDPPTVYDHLKNVIKKTNLYSKDILGLYTEAEWGQINKMVNHDLDLNLTYVAMEQFREKYLIKNRATKTFVETPQMAYILIAAILFSEYPVETRLKFVREAYDAYSQNFVTLPSPIIAGVRSNEKQYSSCVLIETGDSLDSITATTTAIVKYVSQRAGIGIGAGRIRANRSPVRSGAKTHTGVIPYFKLFQSAIGSCSQGGIRKGSGTVYYPAWHLDFEDLIVLKNGRGTEETRVRDMDYGVQLNQLMYERLLNEENITLFSPEEVPEMYEAFFADQDKFRTLYEAAEKNPKLRKKTVAAEDLFSQLLTERKETGRIYFQNVDHTNTHGSFIPEVAPVRMSNLCVEITLPTDPLDLSDPETEIATCILAAINVGKIREPSELEKYCDIAVRSLDAIIDSQKYPLINAELAAKNRRTIGVGIVNFAYWMAKNGFSYDNPTPEALAEIDRWAQAWSYFLLKSSANLAIEKGAAPKFNETKYSLGRLPIDTYKQAVDELTPHVEYHDWKALREQIIATGLRNSTLMALMPVETSSQVANATNGMDPPRKLVTIKTSGDTISAQVVPEIRKLKNKYTLMMDQRSNKGYLSIMAVWQKYVDQSISTNFTYNSEHYENGEVPMMLLIEDLVFAYKYGLKTGYYLNTGDAAGEIDVDSAMKAADKSVINAAYDESCDGCVL